MLLATLRSYWLQFATAFVPRLCWAAFKFAQPFLINATIRWVDAEQTEGSKNHGYGLIAAYGLVYIGLALSQALYWQHTYRFIVMVRGGLISMIFHKTLVINTTEGMCHDPMVLMGTDTEKIALSLRQVHEVWASMIEIALALWLLERQMGAAFAAPAVLTLGLSFLCSLRPYCTELTRGLSLSSGNCQAFSKDEYAPACMDAEGPRKTQCYLRRLS